jgi:hypothetical protein
MVATALPACDTDLRGALRCAGGKVLAGLGELKDGTELSDDQLIGLYGRIGEVMTRSGLDSDTLHWAVAFELLWPKRTVSLARLVQAVEPQLPPKAKHKQRSLAYRAARAAVSAFDLADGDATVGRPPDPRAEAEAYLKVVAGYSVAQIAAVTDPGRGGEDRVRHRVSTVVSANEVPVVGMFSARVPRRKSVELTPSKTLGGSGTSKTSAEVTSNERTQRNKGRKRLPSARRGGPDNTGPGK